MTAQIPDQKIAALNRVLADATKECPCLCHDINNAEVSWPEGCQGAEICSGCLGTGRIARFPEFRQECYCTKRGTPGYVWAGAGVAWPNCPPGTEPCLSCEGRTGWQVRAGGMAGALAGLTYEQYNRVALRFDAWLAKGDKYWELRTDPMPSAPEILLKFLELVIAGLEAPDA